MTRARGEPSRSLLNREYPHQVLLLAETVAGKTLDRVIAFHTELGLPVRCRSVFKNDTWHALYYFADEVDAVAFRATFGGERIK